MKTKQEKEKYNYSLPIHEVDTNTKYNLHYTQKGAELWDWLATRGYVMLIPYQGFCYYYKFAELKKGTRILSYKYKIKIDPGIKLVKKDLENGMYLYKIR